MTTPPAHKTPPESTYESILYRLRFGPYSPFSPSVEWANIKDEIRHINQSQSPSGMPKVFCQRIFHIINFLDRPNTLNFDWECYLNPHGRSLYQDVVQCTTVYHIDRLEQTIESIVRTQPNPFEQISILCSLREIVPKPTLFPFIISTVQDIRTIFDSNTESLEASFPNANQTEFWDDLLTTLDRFDLPISPWIEILETLPKSMYSEQRLWHYRLTDNLFDALGRLAFISKKDKDECLRHMIQHYMQVPHRCMFAFHEIETPSVRCDAGIMILDRGHEIAESHFWEIHDCICQWSDSWYQFGSLLSYGMEYELLDSRSIDTLHSSMNRYFQQQEKSTDTIEWDVCHALFMEWNTLVLEQTF